MTWIILCREMHDGGLEHVALRGLFQLTVIRKASPLRVTLTYQLSFSKRKIKTWERLLGPAFPSTRKSSSSIYDLKSIEGLGSWKEADGIWIGYRGTSVSGVVDRLYHREVADDKCLGFTYPLIPDCVHVTSHMNLSLISYQLWNTT